MSLLASYFGGQNNYDVWNPFGSSSLSFPPPKLTTGTSSFTNIRIDWRDTPEAYVLKTVFLGIKKEGIKVELVEGKILQIRAERIVSMDENKEAWGGLDNNSGMFLRRFRLPENAMVDQVKANMENGVLTVTVPKGEIKKPEVISVEIEECC